jgi:hypothetical protein
MPTLVVHYEVDDNAVDDVVKGRTAVAANKHGPNPLTCWQRGASTKFLGPATRRRSTTSPMMTTIG